MSRGSRDADGDPFKVLSETQLITHVVERLRGERGMASVLRACGLSRYVWARAEAGKVALTSEHREQLAHSLDLTLRQLDDEVSRERESYLWWLEARRLTKPGNPALDTLIEEVRGEVLKARIDTAAADLNQRMEILSERVDDALREAAGAEEKTQEEPSRKADS